MTNQLPTTISPNSTMAIEVMGMHPYPQSFTCPGVLSFSPELVSAIQIAYDLIDLGQEQLSKIEPFAAINHYHIMTIDLPYQNPPATIQVLEDFPGGASIINIHQIQISSHRKGGRTVDFDIQEGVFARVNLEAMNRAVG